MNLSKGKTESLENCLRQEKSRCGMIQLLTLKSPTQRNTSWLDESMILNICCGHDLRIYNNLNHLWMYMKSHNKQDVAF